MTTTKKTCHSNKPELAGIKIMYIKMRNRNLRCNSLQEFLFGETKPNCPRAHKNTYKNYMYDEI